MKTIKLSKHIDKRGFLLENSYPELFDSIKHFFISVSIPGVIRGNHYHKTKNEWFVIIQGTCEVVVKDLETNKISKSIISASENLMIHMEPNKAHAIKNIGKNELILLALINEVFSQENPDTYEYTLL